MHERSLDDLVELLESFLRDLRYHKRSEQTIKTYGKNAGLYLQWARQQTVQGPPLSKASVQAWVLDQMDARGLEPSTAGTRLKAVRPFSAWLAHAGVDHTNPTET